MKSFIRHVCIDEHSNPVVDFTGVSGPLVGVLSDIGEDDRY